MQLAYFDADGTCCFVGDMPMDVPAGGCSRFVPRGTNRASIWFDGIGVAEAQPAELGIPETLLQEPSSFSIDLPAGAVAIVNGARQTGALVIDRSLECDFHIVFRGAIAGDAVVRVQSYATQRREAYPSIGDQLDALWKGFEALSKAAPSEAVSAEAAAMLEQIEAVKASIPKDLDQ